VHVEVGDLVQYTQDPERLGIVVMTHRTLTGAQVCEVIVVCDKDHPDSIGTKRYSNQEYWQKAGKPKRPLDASIEGCVDEYENTIELHQTYGES